MQKDVLILGGGVAGLNAALELANSGYNAHLVVSEPGLGGQLVNTDRHTSAESQRCIWGDQVNISALYLGGNIHASTSIMGSLITRATNNPHIKLYFSAKLSKLSGNSGNFRASVQTPSGVQELKVGAVIAAVGFNLYDPIQKGEYGYLEYPAVLTALEYEQLLYSQTCRDKGLIRPHDGKPVNRVGFIQCVGSRDTASVEYCSSLCCMFTTKETILTKELYPQIDTTVYYLDLRACGKNFDQFVDYAKRLGTKYVRTMVSEVKENPISADVSIRYMDQTKLAQDEFDIVVLATGIRPSKDTDVLAGILGVPLNKYGFIAGLALQPYMTERAGIFTVSGGTGPMDVPETMALSSAAAAAAAKELGPVTAPTKRPVLECKKTDAPAVAVLVCSAGLQSLNADEKGVVSYLQNLPGVALVQTSLQACSTDAVAKFSKTVQQQKVDRIVVGPCALRANQYLFQEMAEKSGINRFLVEQATYPANTITVDSTEGTQNAAEMLRRSIGLVKTHRPLYLQPVPVTKKALVIGGGISGMNAALEIADKGHTVYLLEKEHELGGSARKLYKTTDGQDIQQMLTELKNKVSSQPLIEVFTDAEIMETHGHLGNYTTVVRYGDKPLIPIQQLEHGVTIIATGTKEYLPSNLYLYGKNERVITNYDLESCFINGWKAQGSSYVFIQCVGSRDENRPYCGGMCCGQTIANAITIKTLNPEADVYVLFRDIRTPGFMEQYYKEARQRGVIFVPYEENVPPQVTDKGSLTVKVVDPVSGTELNLTPNLVVLATSRIPSDSVQQLADKFHLQRNNQGFLMETHSGFGPIAFPGAGIFVTGNAHAPKSIADCITQAQGAAGRAARILSQPFVMRGGSVAEVDQDKCAACLTCVRACPFDVPEINRDKKEMGAAHIALEDCRGCGTCTGECPNKAIELKHYEDDQLLARLDSLMTEVS